MCDSIDAASEVCRQTITSEAELEVDRNLEALNQIAACNNRLKDCFELRLESEKQRTLKCVKRAQSSLGMRTDAKAVSDVANECPKLRQVGNAEKTIGDIVKQLNANTEDPRLCCCHSRQFRYEVVCLYILQCLPDYKKELVSGIHALRSCLIRFNAEPVSCVDYLLNIELRLGYVEAIYTDVFQTSFDDDNPNLDPPESAISDERCIRLVRSDVDRLKGEVRNVFEAEMECFSKLEESTSKLARQQVSIFDVCSDVGATSNELGVVMSELALQLENLAIAMNEISEFSDPVPPL